MIYASTSNSMMIHTDDRNEQTKEETRTYNKNTYVPYI